MRRGDGDIARYTRQKLGVTTPGDLRRQFEDATRYRRDPDTPGSEYGRSFRLRPGFQAGDTSLSTSLASGTTVALYLGQAPDDLLLVTLRVNVTAAASGIAWAEVGIATCLDLVMGSGASLIPEGYTDVSATFNSTGVKNTDVTVNIARDAHVFALLGSSATTPFQVTRSDLGDPLAMGWQQTATVRPSTMSNPESFTVATTGGTNAYLGFAW